MNNNADNPPLIFATNSNTTRKRKSTDIDDLRNSSYFKICAIVRQLRPKFIQVLRTPNFRDCQAAQEIRKRMVCVMDLYKHMQIEGERKPPKIHMSTKNKPKLKRHQSTLTEKSDGKKSSSVEITLGKKKEDDVVRGSYVVGGSISSKNFITFISRRPSNYYGQTKEPFRACHELLTGGIEK